MYQVTSINPSITSPFYRYWQNQASFNFPRDQGFYYDMPNCLLNLAIDKVYQVCNCTPFFATTLSPSGLPFCTGPGISCVSQIIGNVGEEGENFVIDKVRKVTRLEKKFCFARSSSSSFKS